MSTVIIGGGGDNKSAIQDLEQASLTWSDSDRAEAEALLRAHTHRIRAFIQSVESRTP